MGVNMKEFPPDKHHFQAKMKEWLDANQETYSQFKDKIQSALKESLCGKNCELSDDEMTAFQSTILEMLDKEDGTLGELTEHFITSVKGGNVFACCLYCYLELDNGLEEITDAMTELELPDDAKYVKSGIKAYL